jgi:7-cyano-7-deazaguanine synthase
MINKMMTDKLKAVVLLSGGIDSSTTLAIARNMGFDLYALSFSYGQRHKIELHAARLIARHFGVSRHITLDIDLKLFGSSALTDDIDVPKSRNMAEMAHEIPVTYVPARNTIFLSYALAWAEVLESDDIFIGLNAVEGKQKLKIHAPLIRMTKAQIIRKGLELGVDYSLTHSCYDPTGSGEACGECDSCLLRLRGFQNAGIRDPIRYKG